MIRLLAGLCVLISILFLFDARPASAENLPVTVQRYGQACAKVGGVVDQVFDSGGSGIVHCTWAAARDITECKAGSNQVTVCTIRCSSAACLSANPNKHLPVWPLSGGPGKRLPIDTLAPQQMAPVN